MKISVIGFKNNNNHNFTRNYNYTAIEKYIKNTIFKKTGIK